MRALALLLLLTACSSDAEEEAAAAALDAQLTSATIDGRPAPAERTPDRLDAIPDAFRGRWAAAGDCGVGSTSVLTVARDRLRQNDGVARPSYILRAGARELSMELADARPAWPATVTLTLLPDGRLRRSDPNGSQATHARCPGAPR